MAVLPFIVIVPDVQLFSIELEEEAILVVGFVFEFVEFLLDETFFLGGNH